MNGLILKMLNALTEEDKNLPAGSPLRACTVVAIPPLAEVTFDGVNVLTITNDRKTVAEHILRDSAYLMTESGKTINTFTPSKIEVPQLSQFDYLKDRMEWDKVKEKETLNGISKTLASSDLVGRLTRWADETNENFKNKKWDSSPLMRSNNLNLACITHKRVVSVETHFKDFVISNDSLLFVDEEGYFYEVGKSVTLYCKFLEPSKSDSDQPIIIALSLNDLLRFYLRSGNWLEGFMDPNTKKPVTVTDIGFKEFKPAFHTYPEFKDEGNIFNKHRSGVNKVSNLNKFVYNEDFKNTDLGSSIILHTVNGAINTELEYLKGQDFEGISLDLKFYKDGNLGISTVYAVEFPDMK